MKIHINKKVSDNELRNKSFVIVAKEKFQQFIQKIAEASPNILYLRSCTIQEKGLQKEQKCEKKGVVVN